MSIRFKLANGSSGTQFGLFVYTYVQQPAELPTRTVKIIDPSNILRNNSHSDLTSKQEFALGSTPFRYLEPCYTNRVEVASTLVLRNYDSRKLERQEGIDAYLGTHMETVIEVLGTSHKFVAETLRTALQYSKPKRGQSTVSSLFIFPSILTIYLTSNLVSWHVAQRSTSIYSSISPS